MTYHDVLLEGAKLKQGGSLNTPKAESLCTLVITSGTTGLPKAVKYVHSMIMVSLAEFVIYTKPCGYNQSERILAYGSMAHISSMTSFCYCINYGCCYGFNSGDPLKFVEDCQVLKPTLMLFLPKLFTAFYGKIKLGIAQLGGCKRLLVEKAIETKI